MTPSDPPCASFGREVLPVWLVTAAWDAVCATALGVVAYGPFVSIPLVFTARRVMMRS